MTTNGIANAIMTRWKTILLLTIMGASAFSLGAYANQARIITVQPISAAHVKVPAPNLVVNSVFWNINATTQLLTGLTLNVTGGPGSLYQIIVSVSCQNLTTGAVYWCAHGIVKVDCTTAAAGCANVITNMPLTPPFDPELTEVHDLSFIVTSVPTVPAPPCTNPNCPPAGTP